MRCDPPEVTAMTDTLNLYYARIANMGDLLNPLIIERCFGYRVERCSFLTGDLCASAAVWHSISCTETRS